MHFRGFYPTSLQRAYRRGFQCHAAELSYTNMFYILFGVSSRRWSSSWWWIS